MLDSAIELASQPIVSAALWAIVGLGAWAWLPQRLRIVAFSALGALVGLATPAVFELLRVFGGSIFGALAQATVLFVGLTLFLAPPVLVADRAVRVAIRPMASASSWSPYVLAMATGLAACLGSLIALWWVTEVHPQLSGSLEVALYGGVAAACLALVRADRAVFAAKPN